MQVILYHVGRNLNRAIRTCFSFGVDTIISVGGEPSVGGNLYAAKNYVSVIVAEELPNLSHSVALENYYQTPIEKIRWESVDSILIGGESSGLPKRISPLYKATIPTINQFCLTVEAALAIGLNEWRRWKDEQA